VVRSGEFIMSRHVAITASLLLIAEAMLLGQTEPLAAQIAPGPAPAAARAAQGNDLAGENAPSPAEVRQALLRAVEFFHQRVARHGGYLWQYSGDLALREAEGKVNGDQIWVQPPGTPLIGEAFLNAYEATGDPRCLQAARDAARALIRGQMRTGGWGYHIEFDPQLSLQYDYRSQDEVRTSRWKRATVLDDDTTSAAVRFLARYDKATGFQDAAALEAVTYCMRRILMAQYPNGSWFGWWEYDPKPHDPMAFPVKRASFPQDWPRQPSGWPAKYVLNDDLVPDMIRTLLEVGEIYRDQRYLAAAGKAGDFLLLAQLPEPQPAWAQQYDIDMQPCWGRKFEPPAISGAESQTVLETLLVLYRRTGDARYLEPVPRALEYLKRSLLPDGRLARFYELGTNRPLYFTEDYQLTYSADDVPTHYGFIWESRLEAIEAQYRRLKQIPPDKVQSTPDPEPDWSELAARVRELIAGLDDRGAWVERGRLRFHKVEPPSGVIHCQTFADNLQTLCAYLKARGK
jgi:hypothetical protein